MAPSGPAGRGDKSPDGESFALKAKLAALAMEVEALRALKKDTGAMSDAGGSVESVSGLAAALEAQTKVLKEALAGRSTSSVTAVKTDLHWPTLGDDRL